MKVTIEIDEKLDDRIIQIQKMLVEQSSKDLTMLLLKNDKEYYIFQYGGICRFS